MGSRCCGYPTPCCGHLSRCANTPEHVLQVLLDPVVDMSPCREQNGKPVTHFHKYYLKCGKKPKDQYAWNIKALRLSYLASN